VIVPNLEFDIANSISEYLKTLSDLQAKVVLIALFSTSQYLAEKHHYRPRVVLEISKYG
jgi:hypothetical protein